MIRLVNSNARAAPVPVAKIPPSGAPLLRLSAESGLRVAAAIVPEPIESGWVYVALISDEIEIEEIEGYARKSRLNGFWMHGDRVYLYSPILLTEVEAIASFKFRVPYFKNWQTRVAVPANLKVAKIENLGLTTDGSHLDFVRSKGVLSIRGSSCCFLKPGSFAFAIGTITLSLQMIGPAFTISFAANPPNVNSTKLVRLGQVYNRVNVLTRPHTFIFKDNLLVAIANDL